MDIESGSIVIAVISMLLLSFVLWIIHKIFNI